LNAWERIHTGDFDGDGRDDLVVLKTDFVWRVLPSMFGPHGTNNFGSEQMGLFEPVLIVGSSANPTNVAMPFEHFNRYVDTDLDNRVDILNLRYTNGFVDPNGAVWFEGDYQNCRNTPQASPMFACTFSEGTPTITFFSNSYVGDFDGNGHPDLIRQFGDPTHSNVGIMNAAMSVSAGAPYSFNAVTGPGGTLLGSPLLQSFVLDVDGDTRAEMLTNEIIPDASHPGSFVTTVWLNAFNLDSTGAGLPRPMNLLESHSLQAVSGDPCAHYIFADANGDGLPDAVVTSCTHEPEIYVNSGNGFLSPVLASSNLAGMVAQPRYGSASGSSDDGVRIIDVNRDGRQDLLYTYGTAASMEVLLATAAGTFVPIQLLAKDPVSASAHTIPYGDHAQYGPHINQVLDVNGDGAQDFIQFVGGELHVYVANSTPADYLARVEQVGGQFEVEVSYTSGVDGQVVGRYPPQTTFPQVEGTGRGLWVASKMTLKNGAGGSVLTETHRYARPITDVSDGWLGFAEHEIHRPAATIVYEFHQGRDTTSRVAYPTLGLPRRITLQTPYDALGHALSTVVTRDYQVVGGQVLDATVRVLKTLDAEAQYQATSGTPFPNTLEATSTKFGNFDAFGNAQLATTTILGSGIEQTLERTTTFDNFVTGNAWMIGLEKEVCTTARDAAARSAKRCTSSSYDSMTGALRTYTVEPYNNDYKLEKTYIFDAYGNVSDIESRDAFNHLRTEHWAFDGDLVYTASHTNALGFIELTDIQLGLGATISTTDVNGVTTSRQVDGFGREKFVAYANGEVLETTISDGGNFAAQGIATIETRSHASRSGVERTYYDGFGRVAFFDTTDFHNHVLRHENSYDPATGWLNAQTGPTAKPAVPGQDIASTVYTRDVMGRPLQINDSGATTTYSYDGVTQTITDPVNRVTHVTLGALGIRAVERMDNFKQGVTTVYEYGPFGLPMRITQRARNGQQQVSTYDYDPLGRISTMTDEALITTETVYSPFGELVRTTERTQGGTILQTVESTYDELGRVRTSFDNNHTLSNVYTYDTAANGLGLLAQATSLDGVVTDFSYDALARPMSETTSYNGERYQFTNAYDGYGRLQNLFFPPPPGVGKVSVSIDYDPRSGGAVRIRSSNVPGGVLWTLKDVDERGHVKRATLGNDLIETGDYDVFGRPLLLRTERPSGLRVRDLSYDYYTNGNMRTRRDDRTGTVESVRHDFLDRLESQVVSVSDRFAFQSAVLYDDFGNIQNRGRNGEDLLYIYQTGGAPHGNNAVTEIHSPKRDMVYEYDARGNQTRAYGKDNDTGTMAPAPSRTVEYTAFDLPRTITESHWVSGQYVTTESSFVYDAFNRRFAVKNVTTGDLVVERGTAFRRARHKSVDAWEATFRAPTGLVATLTFDKSRKATVTYLHTDAIGSLDTITDQSGKAIERRSYTPFGEVRDASMSVGVAPLAIGFTDNRHDTGWLVNMNGRIYDALSARFLSKDPVNTDPTNSQAYDRYSYVWNMPLALTDPTGLQVEQDWGDAHAGGSSVLYVPVGDGLDPIPVKPSAQSAKSSPSAIAPHAADAGVGIAPGVADDQVIESSDSGRLTNEPQEAVAGLFDFIRKSTEAAKEGLNDVKDLAVDYGPVVKEAAFQSAMTVGDFAGSAIKVVATLGPMGCRCTLPQAQNQVDEFTERQEERMREFNNVRAQAIGAHGTRALPRGNVIPRLVQGNRRFGFEHIVRNHWWSSGARGSKFFKMKINDMRSLIDEAAREGGAWNPEGGSRVLNTDMGRAIGTDPGGNVTWWLRVVINAADEVVSAYPIPAP
jgi:RHS repeat-associated protein